MKGLQVTKKVRSYEKGTKLQKKVRSCEKRYEATKSYEKGTKMLRNKLRKAFLENTISAGICALENPTE
jgi:hypothetical protein